MPLDSCEPSTTETMAPRLVLTFDDSTNILDWVGQIALFSRYGACATFFVEAVDQLTPAQVDGLQMLLAAGHEIGCHGFRHLKAVDAIGSASLSEYIQSEISPANAKLREMGIEPISFAYPCSQNDAASDAALAQIFRHARTGSDVPPGSSLVQCDQFFTGVSDLDTRFCFVGKGIDLFTLECVDRTLVPALNRVKERQETIVLYAHNISNNGVSHFVTPETLELILQRAVELGVKICRLCDIPAGGPKAGK